MMTHFRGTLYINNLPVSKGESGLMFPQSAQKLWNYLQAPAFDIVLPACHLSDAGTAWEILSCVLLTSKELLAQWGEQWIKFLKSMGSPVVLSAELLIF